jgi:hypothetical protein
MTWLRGANGYVSAYQSRGTEFETNCGYIFLFYKPIYAYISNINFHHLYIHFTSTHRREWHNGKIFRQSDKIMRLNKPHIRISIAVVFVKILDVINVRFVGNLNRYTLRKR